MGRYEAIDDILDEDPSEEGWAELREVLEAWTPASVDQAVAHAEARLEGWPWALRAAGPEDWEPIEAGEGLPVWWPLVRHLTLGRHQYVDDPEVLAGLWSLEASATELEPDLVGELTGLRALSIAHLGAELEDLEALRRLVHLERLEVVACKELQDIGALAALKALRDLSLAACDAVRSVAPLSGLRLRTLDLRGTRQIESLAPVGELLSLEALVLRDCPWVEDLGPLGGLHSLRSLDLDRCSAVRDLTPVGGLRALEVLTVGRARVEDLSPLAALPRLRELRLRDLPAVTSVPELTVADVLEIEGLPQLTSLSFPKGELERARVVACPRLRAVGRLDRAHDVQSLELRRVGLSDLRSLSAAPGLVVLTVSEAADLVTLEGLGSAPTIEHLVVTYCPRLSDISAVRSLPDVRTMDLKGCTGLHDASPLLELISLESADLSGCDALDWRPLDEAMFAVSR